MAGEVSRISLYLDENIALGLAKALRERGYDALHTQEVGMKGASDEEQLGFAMQAGRVILTHNIKHFRELHRKYWEAEKEPCGIVVSDELEFGELLRRTLRLLNYLSANEMRGQIRFLSDFATRG